MVKRKEKAKESSKNKMSGVKQVGGPAEFRVGDTSHRGDNIEVKLGKGDDALKIIIERKVVRDAVDRVVPVFKEALQALVNVVRPMSDDELGAFLEKKKGEKKKDGDGRAEAGK